MTAADRTDPLLSAAVLKLSMIEKGMADTPGFRVVYSGVLKELGITDTAVETYITQNRASLMERIHSPERGQS